MFQIAKDVLDESQYEMFSQKGQIDFAYDYESTNSDDDVVRRFQVNLFMAKGKPAIAARLITSQIMDFENPNLPEVLGDVSMRAQGLILFAGVTGSGIDFDRFDAAVRQSAQTLSHRHHRGPIEYLFQDDKANINQREVGIDCLSFNEALRALVREDPDIVLVGEMRDYETFEAAIRAAETGHLVFGTIHASSAWQTFGRIYDLFPEGEREQIRKLLSYNLRAIIYQRLLPTLKPEVARLLKSCSTPRLCKNTSSKAEKRISLRS